MILSHCVVFTISSPLQIIFSKDETEIIHRPSVSLHSFLLGYSLQILPRFRIVVNTVWWLVMAVVAKENFQPILFAHLPLSVSTKDMMFFQPLMTTAEETAILVLL